MQTLTALSYDPIRAFDLKLFVRFERSDQQRKAEEIKVTSSVQRRRPVHPKQLKRVSACTIKWTRLSVIGAGQPRVAPSSGQPSARGPNVPYSLPNDSVSLCRMMQRNRKTAQGQEEEQEEQEDDDKKGEEQDDEKEESMKTCKD